MSARSADPLPRRAGRVTLRRLRLGDLDDFQAYRSDPEVGRYQGWSVMSPAGAAVFLETMGRTPFGIPGQWLQIGVMEHSTGALVGDIGILIRTEPEECAELGVTLAATAQGRGLATQALREVLAMVFEFTCVARIMAITDTRNEPSSRLWRRLGLRLARTYATEFRAEACEEHEFVLERRQWDRGSATASDPPENRRRDGA